MFKHKQGFTLSDVLITLGIIGTIAAITIPSIVKTSSEKTTGPMVGRCVQILEQSLSDLFSVSQDIASGNGSLTANSISALQLRDVVPGSNSATYLTDGNTLFASTAGVMGTTQISESDRTSYISDIKKYTGASKMSTLYNNFNNNLVFRLGKYNGFIITESMSNDSITAYINNNSLNDIPSDVVIDRIFIDGNGKEGPNRLGIDVFLFGLTNSGKLVPAGSEAYNNNIFNETLTLYTNACAGTNVTDARSCAARLVADSWKINYR